MKVGIPTEVFAAYWSGEICNGVKELEEIPVDQVMTMRFEDFIDQPKKSIDRLFRFLDTESVDERLFHQLAEMVGKPNSSWQSLEKGEIASLNAACKPGFDALADVGIFYDREQDDSDHGSR